MADNPVPLIRMALTGVQARMIARSKRYPEDWERKDPDAMRRNEGASSAYTIAADEIGLLIAALDEYKGGS